MSGWAARGVVLSTVLTVAAGLSAGTNVGIQEYGAVRDDVVGNVTVFGQQIVHRAFDVAIGGAVRKLPILSVQYAGPHYREGPADDPNHVEGRAMCMAESLTHAWDLLDRGATLEILPDDWNNQRVLPRNGSQTHLAIFVRNASAGLTPFRIVTVYPQDVAGYPWITSERSLAEYWIALMQAHHLLFWKCEADLSRYNELRISRTDDGRIFRETALRALALARSRGQTGFGANILQEVLTSMPSSQRQRLCRLAVAPPMDWESSSR